MYGFAASHPLNRLNDVMLRQVFTWISGQTMPVILGGDLNVTFGTSEPLALAQSIGLWRITSDEPTTKAKTTGLPSGPPLDHVLCNNKMLDLQVKAWVAYAIPISDHYPIEGRWTIYI